MKRYPKQTPSSITFNPDIEYTSSGVKYRLLEVLHTSASYIAINSLLESQTSRTLYHSDQKGIEYFHELLQILPFGRIGDGNNIFLLPQVAINKAQKESKTLNIFECKVLMREIDILLKSSWQKSFISSYNYIRSIIYIQYQSLLPQT